MIGQWENDLRNPKQETLRRIADALNVQVFDIMDDYSPVVRELRNGSLTLEELATEIGTSKERILELLNLEIDDPEFMEKVKKTALKLSMREENIIMLKKYVETRFAEAEAWKARLDEIGKDMKELNDEGQQEAVKRVKELTEIAKYQRSRQPSPLSAGIKVYGDGPAGSFPPQPQPAPQSPLPPQVEKDTTTPENTPETPPEGE